jgi:hypothetical protein
MSSGSYSVSRDHSIDRSHEHYERMDVTSAEFERVRVRQLEEADIRNVRAWVHMDSAAGVWTASLFAGWLSPLLLMWVWSGFGRPDGQPRTVLAWIFASGGMVGCFGTARLLMTLARSRRLDDEWRRRVLRVVAFAAAASVLLCAVAEVFGPDNALVAPFSGARQWISLLPLVVAGVLGLAVARIGRQRNGTEAAGWGGILAFVTFGLCVWPGLDSSPWILSTMLGLSAIALLRGCFALWSYYEYRLVGGSRRVQSDGNAPA